MADSSAQTGIFAVTGEQLDLFAAPPLELEIVEAPVALVVAIRRMFRVLGTTDDVTTCELCGRVELRGTTVLEVLDVEGNGTGELLHYGSSCAARAAGWSTREVVTAAKTADEARREAERLEAARVHRTAEHAYRDHLLAICGSGDREVAHQLRGFASPFAMWKHDRAAGAPGTAR